MSEGLAIGGIVLLAIVAIVIAPVIVALALGALFALPFWPCFWLAAGVGMLTGAVNINN